MQGLDSLSADGFDSVVDLPIDREQPHALALGSGHSSLGLVQVFLKLLQIVVRLIEMLLGRLGN
jgi:hypothetical protein